MSFTSLLNLTADVYAITYAKGTTGGAQKTETLAVSSMPCRIRALSGNERAMRGTTGVAVTHRLYCISPEGVTITEQHEIESGSVRYKVQYVNDVDQMAHHLEIDLLEVR